VPSRCGAPTSTVIDGLVTAVWVVADELGLLMQLDAVAATRNENF
jgi:hypothetical protein